MLKTFTCIVCPNGCQVTAELKDGAVLSVSGASCRRGEEYVRQEVTDPKRTIASSIYVEGGELPLASVRLSRPIPKARIFDVMEEIRRVHAAAPVKTGDVVIRNVLGLGSDVIVTKGVGVREGQ